VDDEPAILTAFQYALEGRDWHVEVAPTAQAGLLYFDKERFDVVVTDKNLPDVDGVELLAKIRKRDEYTQFIVITGHATATSAIAAANLGAVEYLTKPFDDIYAVADVIEQAIKRSHARPGDRLASFRERTAALGRGENSEKPRDEVAPERLPVAAAYAPTGQDWLTGVADKSGWRLLAASTVSAYREALKLGKPTVAILVGSEDAVALVRATRELCPGCRILVVFEEPEVGLVRSFILAGASSMVSEELGSGEAEASLRRLLHR
jgi:CheY-like chemotaxis protein